MNMDEKFCQSCGMPMETEKVYGTNVDGSKNEEYCEYCYMQGKFTREDCTLDDMIEICVPHMTGSESGMTEEEARKMMKEFLPELKRWKVS